MITMIPASMAFCSTGSSCCRVHGDDAEGVHALGDQVLDDGNLLGGVGFCRADQRGVDAVLFAPLVDAFFHAVEPVDAGDLDDGDEGLFSPPSAGEQALRRPPPVQGLLALHKQPTTQRQSATQTVLEASSWLALLFFLVNVKITVRMMTRLSTGAKVHESENHMPLR